MKKKVISIGLIGALILSMFFVWGCVKDTSEVEVGSEPSQEEGESSEEAADTESAEETPEVESSEDETKESLEEATETEVIEEDKMIYAYIGENVLEIEPADNSSAAALIEKLNEGDVTVDMQEYGGFEIVGSLGFSLPTNDESITTEAGDVILYQGNQVTIYYDTNNWNFTRLGKESNLSAEEIAGILSGIGQATVRFSLDGEAESKVETIMLNSGYEMPVIGLGTWTLNNEEAENSVYHALKTGMRLIDTARYYGNEVGVGRGLRKAIEEGIVTREEVFITSKIYGGNYERAGGIIDEALSDLGVEYIDLLLIHQPGSDDPGVYKAMEEAVAAGKLRSIGISNYYTKEQVDEVLSFAEITPAVIQNENHIYYQNNELRDYVSQYGIVIESWYPFGGRGNTAENFNNETILELAEKYGKTSAQVILRWHIQAGYITIPGSSNPDHIAENFDVFDFQLSEDDMKAITDIDEQRRYEIW